MSAGPLPSALEALVGRVLEASRLRGPERAAVEADLRAHFEDGLEAGHRPDELAQRFGDPELAGRRIAEARGSHGRERTGHGGPVLRLADVAAEARRAVRSLLAAPVFSLVVVVTLALGVGANTAVFTTLDAVLLEPLPYPEPDRLVRVYETFEGRGEYLRGSGVLVYRTWDDVFESFGTLYTYREMGGDLTEGDAPERVVVSHADHGFFETLGTQPLLGRTFLPGESQPQAGGDEVGDLAAATPVAVLSHGLWEGRFGADPGVLGRQILLDGASFEVVGVMPPDFTIPFGSPPDLWVPKDMREGGSNSWNNHYLSAVARLREGLGVREAQARLDARMDALRREVPDVGDWGLGVVPLRQDVVKESRRTMLLVLAGAVGLVLLSACVNVGNLVFARNLGRAREIAVRSALGAGRPRLVLHLFMENVLLAGVGALAGVGVGWLGVRGLLALAPDALPPLLTPELSVRVFLVALAAASAALVLFGLVPTLRFSATPPAGALRAGGRSGTEERSLRSARGALVVAQVAVALVLLVGAGLLVRSFAALRSAELGVEPEGVLTFEVHLPDARYPDGASRHRFHQALGARISTLPGVTAAGATSWLPANGRYHTWGVSMALDNEDDWISADARIVAGDYFDALGIDLLEGEIPSIVDAEGPPVVWLSRSLAEAAFGDADPVGRLIRAADGERRVVGVVEDVPHDARGSAFRQFYVPHAHYADDRNWALVQVVRASADPGALLAGIERELAALDGELVLYRPRPLEALLEASRAQDRFATWLMGIFAGLALTLSAVGTYGVLAGVVERRRREIGIRMALGARAGSVGRGLVGSALALAAAGAALGALGAWIGSRWLGSLLFEVEPADPTVFAGATVLLLLLSGLAAWLPARRATRTDPARALGME